MSLRTQSQRRHTTFHNRVGKAFAGGAKLPQITIGPAPLPNRPPCSGEGTANLNRFDLRRCLSIGLGAAIFALSAVTAAPVAPATPPPPYPAPTPYVGTPTPA